MARSELQHHLHQHFQQQKRQLKGQIKFVRSRLLKALHGFRREELTALCRRLGVAPGDRLLVHSSYDAFGAFLGAPSDVVASLQDAVGPGGLVAMPTIPFDGLALDHIRSGRVFDVRRTPSRMGLITEIFRRSTGVVRSVHPTHAVAAWGKGADTLVADHHLAATPCGRGSPYARLAERDGKVLLLGAPIEAMTYFHTLEEELGAGMPVSPFTDEQFTVPAVDATGRTLEVRTRLFNPELSRRRQVARLRAPLEARGAWAEGRVGTVRAILLRMGDVAACARALAAEGRYCYDGL
ncbi:MAG: AAC(3) family N-acetyltransferase [Gemmatimonadetes bacterium]|nr:AAC(3) family N-acetyltransferase [Gemmatimonadota bacterium]